MRVVPAPTPGALLPPRPRRPHAVPPLRPHPVPGPKPPSERGTGAVPTFFASSGRTSWNGTGRRPLSPGGRGVRRGSRRGAGARPRRWGGPRRGDRHHGPRQRPRPHAGAWDPRLLGYRRRAPARGERVVGGDGAAGARGAWGGRGGGGGGETPGGTITTPPPGPPR